ncbi:hypothetical protein N0V82_005352 [Gnomoniopsis sp. IMI 355080]|nr:hypothetical protein N0V82_005352 [Gnomoniopsis sp. IMI 355080]
MLVSDLTSHGQRPWTTFPDKETSQSTPAVYFVTSGTTGLPKLAVISHFSLIFQNQAATHEPAAAYPVIRLACLPLFHIFGAAWALIPPLRHGQPVYIAPRYPGLAAYAHQIHAFAVTDTYMAPPMVHALINNAAEIPELAALLATLRYVGVGGAPIGGAALSALRGRLLCAGAVVSQVWGMTEFGPAALFRRRDGEEAGSVDLSSVGRLLPGYEARFLDVDGVDIGDGPGSLHVRTPGVMLGYRGVVMGDDERAWYPTGDLGCVRNGMLYITGRSKEMIKVKGWQVSPAELEAVILRHPHISDCAVVGVKTADGLGEAPRAFVVPKIGSDLSQELLTIDLCNLVKRELASYKSLETVVCVQSIPRTVSGKTQRYKLLQVVV